MKEPAKSGPRSAVPPLGSSALATAVPEDDAPHPVWIVQRTISGRWVVERPSPPMSVRFAERSEAVAYAYAETRRLGGGRIVVMPVRVRMRNYYSRS